MSALVLSEARVPVAEDQIITDEMLTDVGLYGQGSLDNAILNFLNGGVAYTGLQCAIATNPNGNTASLVAIQPGFFMRGGIVYSARDLQTIDLSNEIAKVPDGTKSSIVLILADGTEISVEGDAEYLDQAQKPADPNAYWPTKVIKAPVAVVRQMNPAKRSGDPALQPDTPSYPASYCLIATAIVDNGSIVSIRQETSTQITRLDQLAPVVAALQSQVGSDKNTIAGLLATVSALQAQLGALSASVAAEIAALLAAITNLGNKQAGQAQTGNLAVYTDYYLDGTGLTLQPNNPTYSVGSGLGFPAAVQTGALSLVNATAGNIAIVNGKLMPAYTDVVLSSVVPTDNGAGVNQGGTPLGGVAFNAMPAITTSVQMRGFGVERTRYGAAFQAQPSANLLANGDPSVLFAQAPGLITYDPTWGPWTASGPVLSHQNGYWHDSTGPGYWTTRTAGPQITGQPGIQQVVVPASDQMMTSFELSVVKGTFGDIRMLVCVQTATGNVDFGNVLADVTCPFANIDPAKDIDGLYGVAPFAMPYPILEQLGKRYVYVFVTSGDHKFRTKGGVNYNAALGSSILVGGGTQPLSTYGIEVGHRKKIASFTAGITDVPLNPIYAATAAGIDTIDITTPTVLPAGCDVGLKLQKSDGTVAALGPISAAAPNLLAGNPQSVILSVSLKATATTAPIIDLYPSVSGTAGTASGKQGGALTAESRVFQAVDQNGNPVNFTKTTRDVTLVGFVPGTHTYAETLETGASYGTQTPPATTKGPTLQPDGTYTVSFTWSLGAAVQAEKVLFQGQTSDTSKTFRLSKAVTSLAT